MAANGYCGPFALAYVLRVSTGDAAAILRKLTGKRAIIGVTVAQMHGALQDHCKRVLAWPQGKAKWPSQLPPSYFNAHTFGAAQPTVREFWEAFGGPDRVYVLDVPGHYMVLDGDRLYDNNGTALASEHYKNRCHVRIAWHCARAK